MIKKRRKILISLVVVELLLVSALVYIILFVQSKPQTDESFSEPTVDIEPYENEGIIEEDDEIIVEDEVIEETEEQILMESGWLPPWYFNESFSSLKGYGDILDIVNPVFYSANSNGTVLNRKPAESVVTEFLGYCKENNIKVIPTVGSYSYDVTNVLFASETAYMKHVQNIIAEVEKYDFDGIDIDYENIKRDKKDNYINFLTQLGVELNEREKILSVTVFAQWGDDIEYKNHADTIYTQDLTLISEIADQVRVMTYDYTLQSSSTPGPIGPIDWMEDVLQYTLSKVPKEKVWLGVHLYGYRWKNGEATALTPASFKIIVSNPNIGAQFKEDIGEGYAQYGCDSTTCYLYYQSKEGVNLRRELASEYEVAGVSYWSIGKDDGLLSE